MEIEHHVFRSLKALKLIHPFILQCIVILVVHFVNYVLKEVLYSEELRQW